MIITKNIRISRLLRITWHHILWLTLFMSFVAYLYYKEYINITIPWLPVSVIGTAVAFYVGFKNNQSYDRMWEARKIWGGIVNDSRTWGMMVDGFVSDYFSKEKIDKKQINEIKKRLIYRHIAWLYAHRSQLLVPTSWEHQGQKGLFAKRTKYYQQKFGIGLIDDNITKKMLNIFLPQSEYQNLVNAVNTATQIINQQSRDLSTLREKGLINDFRHMELEKILSKLFTLQGMNERIKKFPLPRQYDNLSSYFVGIFILMLPFSMIPELMDNHTSLFWLSIPITVLIGWVYVMMEDVADYSENPFQGLAYDIPMLSLCRTIEIDLREMLNETDLPSNIEAKKGVLM